jgi:hypothetical protein
MHWDRASTRPGYCGVGAALPVAVRQSSSLLFAMQIARWASRMASRVAGDRPESASAAALALSPACSSSMTATRSSVDAAALSALRANSRTTATSTGDAPVSWSTAARALSILARAAWSRSVVVATAQGYARPAARLAVTGPKLLLTQHFHGDQPVLVYRDPDLEATETELARRGVGLNPPLRFPDRDATELDVPGPQRIAVYQRTRPERAAQLEGRIDF